MTVAVDTARQAARIAEWMRAVLLPGQIVEVRALDPYASRVFATAEPEALDRLAAYAASLSGRHKGVYYTPNPLRSLSPTGKSGSALDADVAERRWLLIDCDPTRPAGVNATEAERIAAESTIDGIHETLLARGFAGMVAASSGNGWHLMVPVHLPNDDAAKAKHKRFLELLDERFGTPAARIDRKTFNAARIWKLPATLAMKGPTSAERPHRYAKLVKYDADPHRFGDANNDALNAILAEWGPSSRKPAADAAYAEAAFHAEIGRVASAANGTLADTLFRSAAALGNLVGGGLLDRGRVEQALLNAVKAAGGTDERKERDTVRRGLDAGSQTPRQPTAEIPRTTVNGAPIVPAAPKPEPWEPPVPLSTVPRPDPFPTDVLPTALAAYVHELAWAINVPEDFVGVCLLACASGSVGVTRRLLVKRGYRPSACVYAAFVARPGAAKSAVLRAVSRPLHQAEEDYRKDHRHALEIWNTNGCQGERPKLRRVLSGGGTVEGIARRLADQPRGLALVADELSGLAAGLNQYKAAGKGNDRQFFLSAWDHTPYSVERVEESRSLFLPHPYLAVCGGIQPDVIDQLRGDRVPGGPLPPDDGFLDRFLIAYPEQPAEAGEDWRDVSEAAEAAWANAARELLALQTLPGGKPVVVPLGLDGRRAYQEFTFRHAAEVNAEEFPDALRGPWSKLKGYCLRLSLLLHLLDAASDGLDAAEVDGCQVARAERLVTYFKSHFRRMMAHTIVDPTVANATYVLRWLIKRAVPGGTVRFRDVYRSVGSTSRFPAIESLRRPLDLLVQHGHLRIALPENDRRNGRPQSPTYEVNPLLQVSPAKGVSDPQNLDADDP